MRPMGGIYDFVIKRYTLYRFALEISSSQNWFLAWFFKLIFVYFKLDFTAFVDVIQFEIDKNQVQKSSW